MINGELLALLECPKCKGALKSKSGAMACAQCHQKYPAIDDIPWIFPNPDESLIDWRNRADFQIKSLAYEIQKIDVELGNPEGPASRSKRLHSLREGYAHNIKALKELVQPLYSVRDSKVELYRAVKTQLPLVQKLMSYYANIHRDWVWGEEENKLAVKSLQSMAQIPKGATVLVLGSGASRLAYDLHQSGSAALTIALDINPLLLLTAKRIVNGGGVELFEFPIAPKGLQDVCVKATAKAPAPAREGFEFLFADGMEPPIKANSLDVVITPWFIDVVPQELERLALRINRVLKVGGQWFNQGPYGFLTSELRNQLSREEVHEVVQASGFSALKSRVDRFPYLHSPHSCQERFEQVMTFVATKNEHRELAEPYRFLPQWLADWDLPIPAGDAVNRYRFATEIQHEIMSAVDGRHSLNSIAETFAQKHNVSQEEARGAVYNLFSQIFDG